MHKNTVYFSERFEKAITQIAQNARETVISGKNVYRSGLRSSRKLVDSILKTILEEKSRIVQYHNLVELYKRAQEGHSCLMFMEHYSNLDFPGLMYLLTHQDAQAAKIGARIVPLTAMKLNEESPALSALTDAYTHISIFPARRIDQLILVSDGHDELKKAREINHSALKHMKALSHSGSMILMFPSGTRFKPDNPQTKRVVRVADSFLKYFDYVIFGGIAGNALIVNDPEDMLSDYVQNDTLIYSFSKVHACKKFRKAVKAGITDGQKLGVHVAEQIEVELEAMHAIAQKAYEQQR